MKVCLTMIVRDEAHVIERCLASVKPYIHHWVIADTGSKDDTPALVTKSLSGIPGTLRRDKWQDFATNRNLALEQAQQTGCDYVLTLDADEEMRPLPGPLSDLTDEAYCGVFHLYNSDLVFLRKCLVRSDIPWRYVDVIHEHMPRPPGYPSAKTGVIRDLEFFSHHDSCRNRDSINKYKRDAKVLKKALKREPNKTRYWFYLAQTLAGAQDINGAIAAYRKRISLGDAGHAEEVWYSYWEIGRLRAHRGDDFADVSKAYLEAYNCRPSRAEPIWALAQLHNARGEYALAELYARRACQIPYPEDSLLVHASVYRWKAADELAAALGHLGRLDEAQSLLEKLVELPQLPESERPRFLHNIDLLKQAA